MWRRILAVILAVLTVTGGAIVIVNTMTDKNDEVGEIVPVQRELEEQTPDKQQNPEVDQEKPDKEIVKEQESSSEEVIPDEGTPGILDKLISALKPEKKGDEIVRGQDDAGADNQGQQTGSGTTTEQYTVSFVSADGSEIGDKRVAKGTRISSLPTPYLDDHIFVCWYYDDQKTHAVGANDTINGNTTLYADYVQTGDLEGLMNVTFVGATDVSGRDFTISVVSEDKTLSAQTVKSAIIAKNLTDPTQESDDIIQVNGAGGEYVIKGMNPSALTDGGQPGNGFAAGATYQIILTDARLTFKDQPATAREYNFTTNKEQVLNTALRDGIIYLAVNELHNITNNGAKVETLSIALYQADQSGTLGPADLTQGTFEYDGTLEVGDVVSVYAGLRPDKRTLDTPAEENGDVAYIRITDKKGSLYTYENAAPEEVIFEPDILPVPVDAIPEGNELTLKKRCLDYSDDIYANIELDSTTTVDKGDYALFYTGTFGANMTPDQILGYGEILSVTVHSDDTTTISYRIVSWEEVQETMAIYTKERMSGSDMIAGVDTEYLEARIEKQAIDSGFAEEAAQYLGSLALATENFTRLSENMNLQDYKVTLTDGTPISPETLQLMAGGLSASCEMEEGYPKAKISTKPEHFSELEGSAARDKGLVISLEVQAKITIGKSGSDNQLEITVSGTFTEEVGLDLGVSSKAVWKVWGIIPYIAEYRVTANIDVLNYTGIEVNATMITKEGEDEDDGDDEESGVDIAEKIKEILDQAKEGEDEEKEESSNNLVKRYSEMLKAESDWIRVIEQNIMDQEKQLPPSLPIIAVNIELDFVVSMDACVSIGFDFEYLTGKRYTYTIDVFAGKVYNNSVTLIEEQYEFDFYAMGRLAIKAGLEFEFKVGLFSTDLDSVGFSAEAGAYTKMWGYFYYELKYTESLGRNQKYSGALLIDVGAYLDVELRAQALKGKYSTKLTLFDKEWSLWTVGKQDNILDFTTKQEDMPAVKLKQQVRQAMLPDSIFSMHYLDLKEGTEKDAVYQDYFDVLSPVDSKNRKNFDIRMTNDKFTYDPQTNMITVNPDKSDKKLEGEMIITWIQYPLAFSSKPIQRRISLYWDNLRDGYVIVPFTNGGTYLNIINEKYEAVIKQPADPEKAGYRFAGWYSDESLETAYEFPGKMPAQDAYIYAKWEARTDTPYCVEYYREELVSGNYELYERTELTGMTDSYVEPDTKNYTGYETPAKQKVKILADGSAVLRYYYPLQTHHVTFDPGEVGGESEEYELKFGGRITAPVMSVKGYDFKGWDKKVSTEMGTEDLVYTAQWEKKPDTEYRVEYYVQEIDGSYLLADYKVQTAYTGTEVTDGQLRSLVLQNDKTAEELFSIDKGREFDRMTVRGEQLQKAVVSGDGKTVVKLYYSRLIYKAVFDYGYEDKKTEKEYCFGARILLPELVKREGYAFAGWSLDGEHEVEDDQKMRGEDLIYTALWIPYSYTVSFDGGAENTVGTMKDMSFVYDLEQELVPNAYVRNGYQFMGWATNLLGNPVYEDGCAVKNLTDKENGSVVLYAVWKPIEYSLTYFNIDHDKNQNPESYTVETDTINLISPHKTGYVFDGWYLDEGMTAAAGNRIEKGSYGDRCLYAKWVPATDTAYRVEHYRQSLDGEWILAQAEQCLGTTDTQVTPKVRDYPGFEMPEEVTTLILADGSTLVRYEYARKEYTLQFEAAGGNLPDENNSITALYEAPIELPVPEREGYGFEGWYQEESRFEDSRMPAQNLTLTAKWAAGKFGYTVNYFKQNLDDDEYTLVKTIALTAEIDSEVTPELYDFEGFTPQSQAKTLIISADVKENVVNYYYTRNKYQLNWDFAGGVGEENASIMLPYEAPVTIPMLQRTGYTYVWSETPVESMPAHDVSYTAVWTPEHYHMFLEPNGGSSETEVESREITFDAPVGELPVLEKKGYTFDGWFTAKEGGVQVTSQTIVTTPGDLRLYAHFTLQVYGITYHGMNDKTENPNPSQYSILSGTIRLEDAKKKGYTFEGWYAQEDFEGEKVTAIDGSRMEEVVLYARWEENSYTIVFHSNSDAQSVEQNFTYTEEKALKANRFDKKGYQFKGWAITAEGKPVYKDEQTVSKLVSGAGEELHLYAVWQINTYHITYANMEGAKNAPENPDSFSALTNEISLEEPTRTGYTFDGWYKDQNFEKPVSGVVVLDSMNDWIFYAKWIANRYSITFDSGLEDAVSTEIQMMTYDKSQTLTLMAEMGNLAKPGYTFMGWAVQKDGPVVYSDGQEVKNLATSGSITLYASWIQNRFQIQYHLGAGGIRHDNPTSYSIEDNDVKLAAPQAKDGYQFLGWYQGDRLVREIVRGTQEDFDLTAKWACGGTFNLSYEREEDIRLADGSNGKKVIYKVTRTLPEGVSATPNPLSVYYRTVNGTAYGSTVTIDIAGDKYHFRHSGGENVYLTFGPEDMEKTFTIEEWGADTRSDVAARFHAADTDRYYGVELYKVVDTVDRKYGTLGDSIKQTRTIKGISKYTLKTDIYDRELVYTLTTGDRKVTDDGYANNPFFYFKTMTEILKENSVDDEQLAYMRKTAKAAFNLDADFWEIYDGYCWLKLSANGRVLYEIRNVDMPKSKKWYNYWFPSQSSYVWVGLDESILLNLDASGEGKDDWRYGTSKVHARLKDTTAPTQTGVVCMALTRYKAGEQISVTVMYDEIIGSVKNLSLGTISGLPISNAVYTSGVGTNALTFTATVDRDFEVTPDVNQDIKNLKPVSGTVRDLFGN